jgi:hypothetical protein
VLAEQGHTAGGPAYVDADDLPGAFRVSGGYAVTGKTVTVRLVLRRDDEPRQPPKMVEGSADDLEGLAKRLAEALTRALGGL